MAAKLALLLLLGLAACAAASSAAGATAAAASASQGQGFTLHLIHPASTAADASNSTRAERLARLVSKSNARVEWMVKKMQLRSSDSAAQSTYESALVPDGGGYVMQFYVGTPAQRFLAIADTGSDLVWVQSDPCTGCTGASIFHPQNSSTYKAIPCRSNLCDSALQETSCGSDGTCHYIYEYGSGQSSGFFANETLTMITTSRQSVRFPSFSIGCGTTNMGFYGFDGLVGLGQGSISLTSQLANAIDHRFSYCLVDFSNSQASSPIYFGAAATLRGSTAAIQSTPIVRNDDYPSYYLVTVNGISVGGYQLGNPGVTIFDSGTTLTYLPADIYSAILYRFQSLVRLTVADGSSAGFDLCYYKNPYTNYRFPTLTIALNGATLSPPASNYFMQVSDEIICLAMGTSDGLPVSIIGNVMQQGYHILYDRAASQLSFATQNCELL